jgi:hypothetical protein
MRLKLGSAVLLLLGHALAQSAKPLTVCEALGELTEHNGREVAIRGIVWVGHMGQQLTPSTACDHPVVRSGWTWRESIRLNGVSAALEKYYRLRKRSEVPMKIVATFYGRLETRDRFDAIRFPDGSERPDAYGYSVAVLRYKKAVDFEFTPYTSAEYEYMMKIAYRPEAVRATQKEH